MNTPNNRASTPMPPLSKVRASLAIDPESPSGLSRIKATRGPWGKVGPATSIGSDGYYRVKIGGKHYRTHRVIYYLHTGNDPGDLLVDHKDGNHLNNCPDNLRLCTPEQNLWNAAGKPKSVGLPKGIRKLPSGMYEAAIMVRGVVHRADLTNIRAATQWLRSQRKLHHGEFARA